MLNRPQGIIIIQTPFRVSFFGGGTDLPGFFNAYGGSVIGTAINKYIYVTLNSLARFFEKRIRLSYSKLEFVDNLAELEHDIVRCILQEHPFIDDKSFLDIHTYADLPASSGVGSSSAFTVGMLNALNLLNGIYRTPKAIATEAIVIEREKLQHHGGWQDQIFSAHGGFNRINFKNNDFTVEPICLALEKKQALEQACLMFFTGDTRSSSTIHQQVSQQSCDAQLAKMQLLTEEAFQILCSAHSATALIQEFGQCLHRAWLLKRELSAHISTNKIDIMYATALRAGAIGGKLCGAGGGGFLLCVVPPAKRSAVIAALADYKYLTLKFDEQGSRVIYSNMSNPPL